MNLENMKLESMEISEECKDQLRKSGITVVGEVQEMFSRGIDAMDSTRGIDSACYEAIVVQLELLTRDNQ